MKVTNFKNDLKNMDANQLQEKLEQLRRDLFSIKLNAQTAHVKDHSQFKQLRKDIARVLTFLNDKSLQEKELKQ